jgi:hypothetical protein
MWISNAIGKMLEDAAEKRATLRTALGASEACVNRLTQENTRLRSDLDWFKHRLTQVERERGQLIYAALGTKIAVPEFVPTFQPDEALNPQNDPFSDLGEGAEVGQPAPAVDFSLMPRFAETK